MEPIDVFVSLGRRTTRQQHDEDAGDMEAAEGQKQNGHHQLMVVQHSRSRGSSLFVTL